MFVIKLSSGVGNQLFMYAFLKYIEQETGALVYFEESSFFRDKSKRRSEIELIFPNYPTYNKIKWIPFGERGIKRRLFEFLFYKISKIKIIKDNCEIKMDQFFPFNELTYFEGFWQTDNYVDKLINKQELFKPKQLMPNCIESYYQHIISSENSVCMHVRRGDYFGRYIDRYGVCTEVYYQSALDFFLKKIKRFKLFVFSDDLEWVKKNITISGLIEVCYVANFSVNSLWYIFLMSCCKHNIISNSTFSWWGAYLNNNKGKMVVAPNKWRFDSDENLALPSWIKIDVL